MMLRVGHFHEKLFPLGQWLPAVAMAAVYILVGFVLVTTDPSSREVLVSAVATPRAFGRYVFENHWLAIELVSLLLLIALVGALLLGKSSPRRSTPESNGDI
jgi:NADH-quinone oxidoreductase subunit J